MDELQIAATVNVTLSILRIARPHRQGYATTACNQPITRFVNYHAEYRELGHQNAKQLGQSANQNFCFFLGTLVGGRMNMMKYFLREPDKWQLFSDVFLRFRLGHCAAESNVLRNFSSDEIKVYHCTKNPGKCGSNSERFQQMPKIYRPYPRR